MLEQGGGTLLRKRFPDPVFEQGCLLVTQRVWGSVEVSSYLTWVPSGVSFTSICLSAEDSRPQGQNAV